MSDWKGKHKYMTIQGISTIAGSQRSASGKVTENPWTWHVFVLLATAVVALFSRFLHGPTFWWYFEDDFFYYAEVAKRLVATHLSTFDGMHLTNGYHPLWLVLVAFLYEIFPGIGFFVAAQMAGVLATVSLYFAAIRCLAAFEVDSGVRRLAALALSLHALLLFRYGMEVTLTLPIGFWMP